MTQMYRILVIIAITSIAVSAQSTGDDEPDYSKLKLRDKPVYKNELRDFPKQKTYDKTLLKTLKDSPNQKLYYKTFLKTLKDSPNQKNNHKALLKTLKDSPNQKTRGKTLLKTLKDSPNQKTYDKTFLKTRDKTRCQNVPNEDKTNENNIRNLKFYRRDNHPYLRAGKVATTAAPKKKIARSEDALRYLTRHYAARAL